MRTFPSTSWAADGRRYDPSLLSHPTASTAHFYFIDDCLAEVEAELASRGTGLVLRVGHLVGVLESFRRTAQSMTLWSNRVVGVAAWSKWPSVGPVPGHHGLVGLHRKA